MFEGGKSTDGRQRLELRTPGAARLGGQLVKGATPRSAAQVVRMIIAQVASSRASRSPIADCPRAIGAEVSDARVARGLQRRTRPAGRPARPTHIA